MDAIVDNLVMVAAALAALGVIGAALVRSTRWVMRIVRRVQAFLDQWFGDESRPGVPDRLTTMEGRLVVVEGQLTHNGGSSLADQVAQVHTAVNAGTYPIGDDRA
jgi:hypothetical protein